MNTRRILAGTCAILTASSLHAQILSGVSLASEGGALDPLFDLARPTVVPSATAIGFDELNFNTHFITNINNGTYGNPSSWIGASNNSWVGVAWGNSAQSIASFAFGRNNDPITPPVYADRTTGLYTFQYTTDNLTGQSGQGGGASANWITFATVNYTLPTTGTTTLLNPHLRHVYNLSTPLTGVTGIRVIAPGNGAGGGASGSAIDELEFYTSASATGFVPTQRNLAGLSLSDAQGYHIDWNGNDGANFSAAQPANTVPTNLALSGTAFSSTQYGANPGHILPFHLTGNLNDGVYGNNASWLSDDGDPNRIAGVTFSSLKDISSIAWGRDNGNSVEQATPFGDRWQGVWTIQNTIDGSNWTTIGTVTLSASQDTIAGGAFTGYLRHEFSVSTDLGAPIQSMGVRLLTPVGAAIDELEVFQAVPEPAGASLLLLGGAALAARRRRK